MRVWNRGGVREELIYFAEWWWWWLASWAVTKYLLKMDEPSELWCVGVKVWSCIGSCPPYISLVLLNMSPTDCSSASFLDIFLLSAGNLTWFTELQMNPIHTPPSSDDFQSMFSCINLPNAFMKTLQIYIYFYISEIYSWKCPLPSFCGSVIWKLC